MSASLRLGIDDQLRHAGADPALDLHRRRVRAARSQSLFREVNERVATLSTGWSPVVKTDFICECADDACFVQLVVSVDEYRKARAEPNRFLVAPDHVVPEAEVVVAENDRYWTVEKIGEAADVATALHRRLAPARGIADDDGR
jgi:hypothetical protein